MSIIYTIFGVIVTFILVAFMLPLYLGPDDIKGCGDSPSQSDKCQKVDAIVAISGGDTTARTKEAISLYKNGWADTLVVSGAAQDTSGPSNAEVMRDIAVDEGVPADKIIVEERSRTTAENAERTRSVFSQNGIKKVIVVTSAYHQRRASLEFNRYMQGSVTVLSHPVATDSQWSSLWWITPTGWWLSGGELVKIAIFYLGDSS